MSHPARPLRFVIVSPDPGLLHELSWVLSAVGYTVATSKDLAEGAAWRQFSDTDIVLFDGRSIPHPTSGTLAYHSENPAYRFFLYDSASSGDLAAWFAAGANDALRVPISRGELLARVRTGVKILELETRTRSKSAGHRLLGINSRQSLLRKLNKLATEAKSAMSCRTLLTTTIDFLAGFRREQGASAARRLQQALANCIQKNVSGDAILGFGDDDTFYTLLPNLDVREARVMADRIGQQFRAAQIEREPSLGLSVTTSLVPWNSGIRAEQLLDQGHAALEIAAQSGGDCAIEQNEFARELAAWKNELTVGNLFANTIAQDIMEPFAAILERDAPNPALLAALRHGGAPICPFVDHEGRLVGVAASASLMSSAGQHGPQSSWNPPLTNPITIAHNAALTEIYEAFATHDCPTLVVVADRRPLGYLTRSGFLSLFEPVSLQPTSTGGAGPNDSQHLQRRPRVSEPEPVSGSDPLNLHAPLPDLFVLPAHQATT